MKKRIIIKACALAATCAAVISISTPAYSATERTSFDTKRTSFDTKGSLYEQSDSPWINSRGNTTSNVTQLVRQIEQSLFHGLNPENYQLSKILELQEVLKSRSMSARDRQRALSQLESTLDNAYYKLADHIGSSLVEGRDVQTYVFRSSPEPELNTMYKNLASGEQTIDKVFDTIAPTHNDYTRLQDALRDLIHEKNAGLGRTHVPAGSTVSVGEDHETVRAAKLRLLETGDYTGSSGIHSTYDASFEEAVIAFQNRHHISPTGDIDKETVQAMNRSVNEDITQIVVSLERWRWMPRELGEQRVMANVPDFRVRMFNGEQKIADMAAVVGKRKHRTPLFSETIKHVVAAPTWTVPESITNKELVPLERKDPGYLERNNYELLRWNGKRRIRVPFSEVPASDYNKKRFPYTIRQRAGSNNALGDVKILMPNKYAIYFHDTQAKNLFGREERAFSHGCVRLHEPQRLASLIMQVDGESQSKTESFLKSKKTKQYNLDNPIDSHIVYFTTFVDEDGKLNFRNDVYRYDKKITAALQGNSLLGVLDSKSELFANIAD